MASPEKKLKEEDSNFNYLFRKLWKHLKKKFNCPVLLAKKSTSASAKFTYFVCKTCLMLCSWLSAVESLNAVTCGCKSLTQVSQTHSSIINICFLPLPGVIPAKGEAKITVTFCPLQFETSQITFQLVISQFNTKPYLCTITGSCAPHIALR